MNAFMRCIAMLGAVLTMLLIPVSATAAPPPCALYPGDRAATVDALRLSCTPAQQDAIFRAANAGVLPRGVTSGWVVRPPQLLGAGAALWQGKVFYNGFLLNRSVFGNIWPADVYPAAAILDGRPAWAINYAPAGTPQLYDEIREVTPGVWFGYSWRRDTGQQILAFVLAY